MVLMTQKIEPEKVVEPKLSFTRELKRGELLIRFTGDVQIDEGSKILRLEKCKHEVPSDVVNLVLTDYGAGTRLNPQTRRFRQTCPEFRCGRVSEFEVSVVRSPAAVKAENEAEEELREQQRQTAEEFGEFATKAKALIQRLGFTRNLYSTPFGNVEDEIPSLFVLYQLLKEEEETER